MLKIDVTNGMYSAAKLILGSGGITTEALNLVEAILPELLEAAVSVYELQKDENAHLSSRDFVIDPDSRDIYPVSKRQMHAFFVLQDAALPGWSRRRIKFGQVFGYATKKTMHVITDIRGSTYLLNDRGGLDHDAYREKLNASTTVAFSNPNSREELWSENYRAARKLIEETRWSPVESGDTGLIERLHALYIEGRQTPGVRRDLNFVRCAGVS